MILDNYSFAIIALNATIAFLVPFSIACRYKFNSKVAYEIFFEHILLTVVFRLLAFSGLIDIYLPVLFFILISRISFMKGHIDLLALLAY